MTNLRIRKLLSEIQLGDVKPSQLLRKMRELAGKSLSDDFLTTLWFQRLPSEIQTVLSVSSESLDNLAKLADKIIDVRGNSITNSVCAASYSAPRQTDNSPLSEMSALRAEISALRNQVEHLSRAKTKQNSRWRNKSPHRPSSSYRKSPHRSDTLCFYHYKFGENALKCKKPCSFQNRSDQKN